MHSTIFPLDEVSMQEGKVSNEFLSEEDTPKVRKVREKAVDAIMARRIWEIEGKTGIYFRLVEINGKVKLMLEINENATNQGIRDIAPLALEYRDRVEDSQLEDIALGLRKRILNPQNKNELLTQLALLQQLGDSYAKLAMEINAEFSDCLYFLTKYQQNGIKTLGDLVEQRQRRNLFELLVDSFYSEDLESVLEEGVENIKQGKPPFADRYPVSRRKMIEVLRAWRKSKYFLTVQEILNNAKKEKGV